MPTFSNIDGEESATVTFSVGAISLTRNSSAELQEILCLGDPDVASSLGLARVIAGAPDSSHAGLVVRQVGHSTTVQVSSVAGAVIARSSAASFLASVYQSTAADLNVTVAGYVAPSTTVTVNGNASSNSSLYLPVRLTNGTAFLAAGVDYTDGSTASNIAGPALLFDNGTNATMRVVGIAQGLPVNVVAGSATSTTVNVSSLGGAVIVRSSAADFAATISGNVGQASTVWAVQVDGRVRAQNSTIGDLLASVQQNSTVWQVQLNTTQSFQAKNSTIGDLLASVQQNSTVWQVQNKPVFPTILSTSILVTSTHSTAVYELIASGAALRQKVTAYVVGSTHTNPSTLVFMSSLVIDRWHVPFGSGSSGMTGANLANSIPIFVTDAANALNCRIEGGSSVTATVVARVSVGYVSEA